MGLRRGIPFTSCTYILNERNLLLSDCVCDPLCCDTVYSCTWDNDISTELTLPIIRAEYEGSRLGNQLAMTYVCR
jgi:hypothetical protein